MLEETFFKEAWVRIPSWDTRWNVFIIAFLKRPTPASFSFIFLFFKQSLQFSQQINVKKCPSRIRRWDSNSQLSDYKSPPLITRPGLLSYCLLLKFDWGQWLWSSWQSGRFQFQRTRVQIQSSATFIEHLFTVNCLEKRRKWRKRGREWPIFLKKSLIEQIEN